MGLMNPPSGNPVAFVLVTGPLMDRVDLPPNNTHATQQLIQYPGSAGMENSAKCLWICPCSGACKHFHFWKGEFSDTNFAIGKTMPMF